MVPFTKEEKRKPIFEDLDGILICPRCSCDILRYHKDDFDGECDMDWDPEYCPECGQHLDWSS